MPTTDQVRFSLPRINSVSLHAFSLYSRRPDGQLLLNRGVTCLAGANGIGKSTFLSTVNYALTGAVPDPERPFLSAKQYFEKAQDYTRSFFDGRIQDSDRDAASVTIDFTAGSRRYVVTRHFFTLNAISSLQIFDGTKEVELPSDATAMEKEDAYRRDLCQTIGLSSFDQFVMLQHFVFTFDESRHLIFWDKEASSTLLYVCFGGDPADAARADYLNREMQRAGSWGRNLQFQATNLSKRMEMLEESFAGSPEGPMPGDEAEATHKALREAADRAVEESDEADAKVNEAELKVMAASSNLVALRAAYNSAFERFINGGTSPAKHPLVASALGDCRCPICRSQGDHVRLTIEARLKAAECPLCGTSTANPVPSSADSNELSKLDAELAAAKRKLDELVDTKTRLTTELAAKREAVKAARTAAHDFEEANKAALEGVRGRLALLDGPIAETLDAFRKARADIVAQRDKAYGERDQYKKELRVFHQKLQVQYAQAEQLFVPKFKSLARAFLGVDLDITMITGTGGVGLQLQIELRGSARRKDSQLSESQRFFVDIALRMALAQHISEPSSPATLFIDTPEGSLDIAYEDRAGRMFADFVRSGHSLLMTANVNSSKLLTTLARTCTAERMSIIQMTQWTELSDVQQEASTLFRSAYAEIDAALNGQGS
jgi:DNA repair exonuclease SbcCD ATPase subunit